MASVRTPEDIINMALADIGHTPRIGSVYEGSEASKVALDLYAETRDEVLASEDWGFANRSAQLTLLKSAPAGGYGAALWNPLTNPQIPWAYEFQYPRDCIRLLGLQPTPAVMPELDPQPVLYQVGNDNAADPFKRVILAQVNPAIAVFTGRVTDVTLWEPPFVRAVVKALALRFTAALAKGQQLVEMLKDAEGQAQAALAAGDVRREV